MSNVWPYLLAIVALLISCVAAVCVLGFVMAAAANSSPAQMRTIKSILWSTAIVTVLCVAGSIVLMCVHLPWIATAVGGAPAATVFVAVIALIIVSVLR